MEKMAICRYTTYAPTVGRQKRWGWVREGQVFPLEEQAVLAILTAPPPEGLLPLSELAQGESFPFAEIDCEPGRYGHPALAPPLLSGQEVWAAGVTYESSKMARMAESEGGGDFYAKVYMADRPELFMKGTLSRTVGTNDKVRIRKDSNWNVPEPELAVLIAATGQILGYTVGNDMSSRDIEGENPLYLPQAKVYTGSCALGPVVIPAQNLDGQNLTIKITISRGGAIAFFGETSTARMKRRISELAAWLYRENEFPQGTVMLTGTGLIPPDEFSLKIDDLVEIEIEGIGTLKNTVAG